jgi:hypothetical protein
MLLLDCAMVARAALSMIVGAPETGVKLLLGLSDSASGLNGLPYVSIRSVEDRPVYPGREQSFGAESQFFLVWT